MEISNTNSPVQNSTFLNGALLFASNALMMILIGYLTIEVEANQNSRIGAFLLSFFIPIFIVIQTSKWTGMERMLKFGFGFIANIIIALVYFGLSEGLKTGILPCLIVSIVVLYFGTLLVPIKK